MNSQPIHILLLADPNSSHTIKWACSLAEAGCKISLFGLDSLKVNAYNAFPQIQVFSADLSVNRREGSLGKVRYLRALPRLRKLVGELNPDIVHAHYATSYGLLGALCGFHPFILSIWGSDIFSFPRRSTIHRVYLKFILRLADKILSTSVAMKVEAQLYTSKAIEVTPFGIDLQKFKPMPSTRSFFDDDSFIIGTIKTLEPIYGIEYLLRAFKIVADRYPALPLRLLIVGGGSLEKELKALARELGISKRTFFTGNVSPEQIPAYHNMLSIFVAVSLSESFGVAVLEASACEKPVIVSNVGGLPEVVEDGITGYLVDAENPELTAKALEKLILDAPLRQKMGLAGRNKVLAHYDWSQNVQQMLEIYRHILKHDSPS